MKAFLAGVVITALGVPGARAGDNPYQYDVGKFRDVDPALVRYAETATIAATVDAPAAIAVDARDRLYVAGSNRVAVFDRSGRPAGGFDLESPARCMAVTESGDVLVGAADHVDVYAPTGGLRVAWVALGERALLTSVAARGGDVYVADCGNRAVWHFDGKGRLLGRTGPPGEGESSKHFIIPSPYFDVVVAPDRTVWIANPGRQLLEHCASNGRPLGSWGKSSMQIDGFCGCCNPSHIAVLPDGRLVTSEKGIPRVKVYETDGALAAVVAAPDVFTEGVTGLDLATDSAGRIFVLDPSLGKVRVFEERK
jgi:DNA-binding beta-propeller fold protein YncE